jgi:hypothetical protein
MPTSRNVTLQRVLPVLLAIPIMLLFLPIPSVDPGAVSGLSSGVGPFRLSHRFPIPIPWEDDVLATGLPTPPPIGKRALRKLVPARILVSRNPPVVRRRFPPDPRVALFSPLDTLTESLHLSRPPPTVAPFDGNGGKETTAYNISRSEEEIR